MELKDFIKTSLLEICSAIDEANKELSQLSLDASINPYGIRVNSNDSQAFARTSDNKEHREHKVVQKVDFDVAVVSQEDKSKEGGAKISIASIGIGGSADTSSSNKSESRLKFSIPVIYPEGK